LTFYVYIVYLYYMKPLKITKSITNRETPSFEKYLSEVSKTELINAEKEVELARLIKKGNQNAINQLVNSNLRFVISVAKQYAGRGMSVEDLVSEGNIGLIKAAQKWDETRGIKFISYAVWWIRQSILQSLSDNSRSIRLPLNQINALNKINSTISKLEQDLQRIPTSSELSELLNIDEKKIELSLKSSNKVSSLDMLISTEGDLTLLDTISSDSNTDDLVNQSDMNSNLIFLISKLSEREQIIIKSLFGIGVDIKTISEVSMDLHLTSERVRQIKNLAIKKLNKSLRFSTFD
jgi:RNA polymerase primary sigma factor